MVKYQGKGVYGAIAIGKALKWKREDVQVKREKIEDVAQELERLRNAINKAMEQLESIYEKALEEVGEANAQIFEIHRMMLEDDDYNDAIVEMIQGQNVNAEYAVAVTADNFAEMFSAIDDSYMQARAADVRDISNRLILCLKETGESSLIADEKVIICADDLAPSETVTLEKDKVLAFVTAYGSSNSHTAILARNMNIPAIIGVGEEFLNAIEDGELAIANGFTGEFILHPNEELLEEAKAKQREEEEKKELLEKLKGKDNVTLDGTKINIYANIGSVEDVGAVLVNDAGGIGLFRSEFLYLGREDYPSEEEQFKAYKRVLESMASKKVIIRTLDIGADKQADYFNLDKEENPALGLRAIRLCLTRPDMFKTQLRALYRASVHGKLGIMFPMITSTEELEQIFALCEEVKAEITADGLKYSDTIELGIMIETPAAAVISDQLAPMVDFFSVGTNDLTQYTLACDRQNPKVDPFCDIHHEAILRLIEMAAQNAHKNGAWIGICGELAADTRLTERFLRMGIDELSVSPSFVLKVRDVVRKLDLHNA
ncbi:MAG: phosphoenolpyruvate--protein phosphotransferase [Lachnospiraceae bacterium]|nr:phosphoenolpyruvate--protein phosphotransferase [Lachnospiraceae bacterium]MBQ3513915.1 phosphoenolpyruvate--protein phosphotransferase [Lachnospiraceae bacterium]